MDAKVFGAYIAALRKEKNMTQAQLAEKLHVTDKAVSKWERGLGIPDISNMEALAEALDITLAELIQCKKNEASEVGVAQVDEIISATLDISRYQKKMLYRGVVTGIGIAVAGILVIFAGLYVLAVPQSIMIGGADGPTAIFVAGKIGGISTAAKIAIAAGCISLTAGLWKIFKAKSR